VPPPPISLPYSVVSCGDMILVLDHRVKDGVGIVAASGGAIGRHPSCTGSTFAAVDPMRWDV
jgi:hypothetical protein